MADMDELMHPQWLDKIGPCWMCGGELDVRFNPESPYVTYFECKKCGSCGTVSTSLDEMVYENVTIEL